MDVQTFFNPGNGIGNVRKGFHFMYKIALLGDAGSIHIRKWVKWYLKEGHEVLQITTRHLEESEIYNRNIHFLPDPEKKTFPGSWTYHRKRNPMKAKKIVDRFDPDIVHVHRVNDELNLEIDRKPLIMSAWGSEIYQVDKGSFGHKAVMKNLSRADWILGTTVDMLKLLNRDFKVPMEKMEQWSWGVDLETFQPVEDKSPFKNELGYSEDDLIILSPRGITPIYRNNLIVQGFQKISGDHPEMKLVILGNRSNPETEGSLHTLIDDGQDQNIRIVKEHLDIDKTALFMKAADLYIGIPRSDQLSSALLESMACGCIPIVSDLPAYEGSVTNGENGYVLGSVDVSSISRVLDDAFRGRKDHEVWRKKNQMMVSKDHNWNTQAKKMIEIYEKALMKYR